MYLKMSFGIFYYYVQKVKVDLYLRVIILLDIF